MAAILWLIVGVGLAVAEAFALSLVLVMFALGAFAAAGAAALDVGPVGQLLVFGVVSDASLAGLRPILRRQMGQHTTTGDEIGLAAIEGADGLVLEQVDTDHGLVKIDGEMWRARPYDATQVIQIGEQVRVIEVKGATAMVWRD